PQDWENATIFDPFLSDVSSSCTKSSGRIEIPEELLDRLGWWKFSIDGPNYAQSLSTQKYNVTSDSWFDESIFRSGNKTRVSVSIGTLSSVPATLEDVNVTWFLPNSTIWTSELIDVPTGNSFYSSEWILDSINTTAGLWSVNAFWNNGTELAYASIDFEIHHRTTLILSQTLIEASTGDLVSNMVRFMDDETNKHIGEAATVVGNWSSSTIDFQLDSIHNWYEADFDTGIVGAGDYTVLVNASGTYFDDATASFKIKVTNIDNTLTLDHSNGQKGLKEIYLANLTFRDQYGVGIEGASFDISYSGPTNGILWTPAIDLGSGEYRIELLTNISGSYVITISGYSTYYEAAEDTLFLLVENYASSLTSPNGTSAVTNYGQPYHFVLQYANTTGYGLVGANVSLINVVPSTGMLASSVVDEGAGYYSILLTPLASGTFTFLFEAKIINHQTQFYSFVLSADVIETLLIVDTSSEVMAVDEACYVTLTYTNDTGYGLTGATLTVLSPPDGLIFSTVIEVGNGVYTITITATSIGEYQLRFRASLDNHLDATAATSLSVTLIPTRLRLIESISEISTSFLAVCEIPFYYQRLDQNQNPIANITSAEMSLNGFEDGELIWFFTQVDEYYILHIMSEQLGTWDIEISANLTLHTTRSLILPFEVHGIETEVNTFPFFTCYIGRDYTYIFEYRIDSNDSIIEGATIEPSGRGSLWLTTELLSNGNYSISFSPEEYGYYSIILDFEKYGFETASTTLSFVVEEIPIDISISYEGWKQGYPFSVNVTLVERDTRLPVEGAIVVCVLSVFGTELAEWDLVEMYPGRYIGSVSAEWSDSGVSLHIIVEKDNYHADDFDITIDTESNPDYIMQSFLSTYLPPGLTIIAFLFVSTSAIRYNRRRNEQKRRNLSEITSRFDDANNLLGVLILHKKSGLPIYSKILKGGFEEGMISAFISAITHFRAEFDNGGTEDGMNWRITPISDIIRAAPTENLICAFITISSPSMDQEAKMLVFTHAIGMKMDDQLDMPPAEVLDKKTSDWITSLFDKHLDGELLKHYRFSSKTKITRKFNHFRDAIATEGLGETFSLVELTRGLVRCGIDEGNAYKLVIEAIDDGLLVSVSI
ncbi:MAG: hypothetical protein ACFFDR_07775, partial [Candidatus Thorarchaeota archaeon]